MSDPSAASITEALGINQSGNVVGIYEDASNNVTGFFATPSVVPEPSSLVMVAIAATVGLGGWAGRRYRSRAGA